MDDTDYNGHDGTWTTIPCTMTFDVHYKATPGEEPGTWDVWALPCTDGGAWFSPGTQCGQLGPDYPIDTVTASSAEEAIRLAAITTT